jgi:hypothetical protein
MAAWWRLAHAQVAHDVLDLDDGVVHQDADHQRQRQQRDDVDGKPSRCMPMKAGSPTAAAPRPRPGGAPVAQEQPHHHHGQHGALVQQVHELSYSSCAISTKSKCLGERRCGCSARRVERLLHAAPTSTSLAPRRETSKPITGCREQRGVRGSARCR